MATVDRISDLPESILHHILFFLPAKDVYKTSSLSKTFLSCWSSFPVIVLNYYNFSKSDLSYLKEKFKDSLKPSIQRRNIETDLHTFRLKVEVRVSFDRKQDERIDEVIDWAIRKRVKQLDLDVNPDIYHYKLLPIKSLDSITRLSLRGFELSNYFNDLIGRCPVIERLQIRDCSGLQCFEFSSASIKSIELKQCEGLDDILIKSPSLEKFTYSGLQGPTANKGKTDISNCVFLKVLSLEYAVISEEWVEHTIPPLANLQDLKFVRCSKVENMKISNENLKRVTLLEIGESLKTLEMVGKNLQYLNFNGCRTCKITRPHLVSFISSHESARSLGHITTVTLSIQAEDHLPDSYFAGLHDFILYFSYCKFLTLICSSCEKLVIPNKLRGKTIKLLHELISLKHLKIVGISSISAECADSLLWLFPSVYTLCFASDVIERRVKFRREKFAIRDHTAKCCSDLHRKCWRHYFKIVRFVNFDNTDGINLRKYFERNGKVVKLWE